MSAAEKVLIVCPAGLVSGKEVVSLNLGRALRAKGLTVEFVTSRWGRADFRERIEAEGFVCHQLWLGFIAASLRWQPLVWTLDQLRRWPQLAAGYRDLLARTRPDVVIHTNWHHVLLLAPWLDAGRDIYWSHDLMPDKPHYGRVFRMIAGRVARLVCVSQAACRSLATLGVPAEKLAVVHNGIAVAEVVEPARPGDVLRLGIVGQVAAWKGHQDAVAAVARLTAQGHPVILKIFGGGADEFATALRAEIAACGIEDKVEWCGFVRNQAEIFGRIDLLLVPSRVAESFGMVAAEAGIFARPVICTALGGLLEVVESGKTGMVVAPQRPDLLAMAIQNFIDRPALVREMGCAGRHRALAEFSEAAFGDRFLSVIHGLERTA